MSRTGLIVIDMINACRPTPVAHIHEDLADAALRMMEGNMSADVSPARG